MKARLAAYRHRALAATLVARRLAPTPADMAALDEQLGLLHFDQVPEAGSGCFEDESYAHLERLAHSWHEACEAPAISNQQCSNPWGCCTAERYAQVPA